MLNSKRQSCTSIGKHNKSCDIILPYEKQKTVLEKEMESSLYCVQLLTVLKQIFS